MLLAVTIILCVMQASKKGEFSLPGSKEKQVKSMMEKWSTFKDESKGL